MTSFLVTNFPPKFVRTECLQTDIVLSFAPQSLSSTDLYLNPPMITSCFIKISTGYRSIKFVAQNPTTTFTLIKTIMIIIQFQNLQKKRKEKETNNHRMNSILFVISIFNTQTFIQISTSYVNIDHHWWIKKSVQKRNQKHSQSQYWLTYNFSYPCGNRVLIKSTNCFVQSNLSMSRHFFYHLQNNYKKTVTIKINYEIKFNLY